MHEHHHSRTRSRRKLIVAIAMVLVYLVAFAAILLIGPRLEAPPREEVRGSLEGRFQTVPNLITGQGTYRYRLGDIDNYLVVGVDRRSLNDGTYAASTQADFLLLLSIDKRHKTLTPIMIDRDTMTDVQLYGVFGDPAGTQTMQICLAQGFSGDKVNGSENTVQAVTKLLHGIPIDHYVTLDMAGINILNDALGGVTVTIEDDLSALDPALKAGETVLLKGEQAELFVRSRRTVADGTNESRMRRQKLYLTSLLERFEEVSQEDLETLETVLTSLEGHLYSDMTHAQMISAAQKCAKYAHNSVVAFAGTHQLGSDGFMEFYPDKDGMVEVLTQICYQKEE